MRPCQNGFYALAQISTGGCEAEEASLQRPQAVAERPCRRCSYLTDVAAHTARSVARAPIAVPDQRVRIVGSFPGRGGDSTKSCREQFTIVGIHAAQHPGDRIAPVSDHLGNQSPSGGGETQRDVSSVIR